ncbi:hypothetical protein KI688_008216 [Linnemannia hyalina]|uniref:Uncharacterized protein n=1 Tax=Linnemannia hyalina TaxID=64524 RepID=A0A9P8BZ13_9FUNG|nr:hypothetical protein KI688_008216 [Linnemannia hyalina]
MRYQSLALLAIVCSVVLAREDTAELCTGALSCDEGYCCSSHVLDQQNLPRVISYKELGQGPLNDLAKQLADQGFHFSLDELKSGIESTASIIVGNSNAQPVTSALDINVASPADVPEPKGALLVENDSGDSTKADSKKTTETPVKSDASKLTASVAGAVIGAFAWFF